MLNFADIFPATGIFPFDHLVEAEKIILLYEVAQCMIGDRKIESNILTESALYVLFVFVKIHVEREIESEKDLTSSIPSDSDAWFWRKCVLEAWESTCSIVENPSSIIGLKYSCTRISVFNTVITLLARSIFGNCVWFKIQLFSVGQIELRAHMLAISTETWIKNLSYSYLTMLYSVA